VSLSEQAVKSRSVEGPILKDKEGMMDLNIQLVKVMVERMTAKRVRLFSSESLQPVKKYWKRPFLLQRRYLLVEREGNSSSITGWVHGFQDLAASVNWHCF
jgi:hypothetical protein